MRKIYAALLAGGNGSRYGSELPKQFLQLGNKPVMLYPLTQFMAHEEIARIIIAVAPDRMEYIRSQIYYYGLNDSRIVIIEGGNERHETLDNICRYIVETDAPEDGSILLSHDAVRPFLTKRLIDDNIKAVDEVGFSATVVPSNDTVIEQTSGGFSVPERKNLYCCQTPQGFRIDEYMKLCDKLTEKQKVSLTDASRIYALAKKKIALVEGEETNIKITTKTDMKLAEILLKSRGFN